MSDRLKITAASQNIVFVPLNKLKKSPKNVRQVPHTKAGIQAFAASIAAIGMLQYPVVEPELGPKGKPTGCYLVNAGEGRRLAQLLRAKRKEIKGDEPIPCILDIEHSATEISLAENAIRSDMHPADQYEAFAKLHGEEGMSAEDIREAGRGVNRLSHIGPPQRVGATSRNGADCACSRAGAGVVL
jgi:ParB family transcriptional regulator, chromosome partitioning protein